MKKFKIQLQSVGNVPDGLKIFKFMANLSLEGKNTYDETSN